MEITDSEAAALLKILAATEKPRRQPGDIDRMQYARELGISPSSAYDHLKKKVAEGLLIDVGSVWDPHRHAYIHVWRSSAALYEG